MPLNFDLAGKAYEPIETAVTAEQIERYAKASGDPNPRYEAGPNQVAPPVFAVVPAFVEVYKVTADPELAVDNPLMIVHGEHSFRYYAPLIPREKLTLTPTLDSVEDKGRGATFVVKISAVAEDGDPIVDQWATIFVRDGGSGQERPPSPKPPPERKGAVAAEFTRTVLEDMPSRYAEASGDHNPIHLDESVAKSVGLPGVINHGMGTLSLVAGGLVDELAEGNVERLVALGTRFTDMVIPGSDLETTARESGRPGRYSFETIRPDDAVVMEGTVEVEGG